MKKILLAASLAAAPLLALAQGEPLKIGVILPMTGQSASTGKQIDAAIKLWMQQTGGKVGGRKVEVLLKDDAGVADTTRRLAQELVVNDKVVALAGFGLTPLALATAPIATQSKTPMVVMAAATSSITEASPYIVRTSFTLPQAAVAMGEWAPKNGIKKVVTLVADYGPGNDAEKYFSDRMTLNGAQVLEKLRTPLRSPDFAPVLQKVRDAKPDALFVFLPSGQGAQFMKQFGERGLDKAGIKLIATGDVTDDDQLNDMGDVALGVVNAHHYSAAHNSPANKKFVADFQSFALEAGRSLALLGRNGTGKTTLLDTIVGVTRRFSGQITLAGTPLHSLPAHHRAAAGVGWVPQERNIFKSLTVEENLTAVARPGPWDVARVYQLFPRLEERRRNPGTQLSGGEQQMLAFGRALVLNPKLLLLDEPLEGLAPIIVQELLGAIRRVAREEGLPSIVVEQHPHLVLGVTDDAMVLDRGGVAYRAFSAQLLDDPAPLDTWLGVAR